jgi:tRNA uridine 5-carboxymethylaminomethyl modification enzyme
MGLVDDARWAAFESKRTAIDEASDWVKRVHLHPGRLSAEQLTSVFGQEVPRQEASLAALLRRPGISLEALLGLLPPEEAHQMDATVCQQVDIQFKYEGYIQRQEDEIGRRQSQEDTPLPEDLDYASVRGLSVEVRQVLVAARPATVGQAGRLPGLTPAAISLLLIHLKRMRGRAVERAA